MRDVVQNQLENFLIRSPILVGIFDSSLQCQHLSNAWASFAGFQSNRFESLAIGDLFETGSRVIAKHRLSLVLEKKNYFCDFPAVIRGASGPRKGTIAIWPTSLTEGISETATTPTTCALVSFVPAEVDAPNSRGLGTESRLTSESFSEPLKKDSLVDASPNKVGSNDQVHHLSLLNRYLNSEVSRKYTSMQGRSGWHRRIQEQISTVANTPANVFIHGEHGTGKQLIARMIHCATNQSAPFIRLNCTRVSADRFDSVLFGRSGDAEWPGYLALAKGGTFYLQHADAIPQKTQEALFAAIESGRYSAPNKAGHLNVRIVASSVKNIQEQVLAGQFHEELYYRLSIFPISVKPLRERIEDVPLLAQHFASIVCEELGRPAPSIPPLQIERLKSYLWPGNMIELKSLVERAVMLSTNSHLRLDLVLKGESQTSNVGINSPEHGFLTESEFEELERDNLLAVLKLARWRISGAGGAAELLGIKPSTLAYRMKRLKISREN